MALFYPVGYILHKRVLFNFSPAYVQRVKCPQLPSYLFPTIHFGLFGCLFAFFFEGNAVEGSQFFQWILNHYHFLTSA